MSYWRFPTSIFTRYSIQEVIRSSGLSKVYKAQQHADGEQVAVKVLRLPPGMEEQLAKNKISRFEREASLCKVTDHPNIIRLIEYVHEPWHAPYAVYEYVPGSTLKELIWQKRGLSGKETAIIMTQVLDALRVSHANGIVHRDLKPENIMVAEAKGAYQVKLLDFGIGTWQEPDEVPGYQPLTLPNEFLGTPAYAAPEQLIGTSPTVKFDLYAWGLILLECLTGRPAITGHSLNEVVCRQLAGDTIRLPRWMDQHPVAELLEKVLTRNPLARMANVNQVYDLFTKIDLAGLHGKTIPYDKRGIDPGQQTTMTQNFVQHQDFQSELLAVACIRVQLARTPKCQLTDGEVEAIRMQEYEWLTKFIKEEEGKVVSVLANSFMITFSQSQLGKAYALNTMSILLELYQRSRERFKKLLNRYQLDGHISLGFNAGLALVEPNGTPFGIIPNVALDLMSKAKPGQVLVGHVCKELLMPHYFLTPFSKLAETDEYMPATAYQLQF